MDDFADIPTLSVRSGTLRTEFQEHSEALFLTSSFTFKSAAEAAERFASTTGEAYVYSRFSNPTVSMLQDRLAALEGGESCVATASGMSAILAMVMGLMKSGEHVVCSNGLFGATVQLFTGILARFGIETTFVPIGDLAAWEGAVRPNTRLFFVETPSNPLMEIADIAGLAAIARRAGVLFAVDNCLATPALQRPIAMGADLVIHSATKYLEGQGRVLGGAIVGPRSLVMGQIFGFLRTAGPSISPFNAWVILKGIETLELRMLRQSETALKLAQWLEKQPAVERVYYPGLDSHPQRALALRQQRLGGAVLSFDVRGGREAAWRVIDSTRLISITGNLGDVKTTITHPATTTHGRISAEARVAAGIGDGLLRIAAGLESAEDLMADLERGLRPT